MCIVLNFHHRQKALKTATDMYKYKDRVDELEKDATRKVLARELLIPNILEFLGHLCFAKDDLLTCVKNVHPSVRPSVR